MALSTRERVFKALAAKHAEDVLTYIFEHPRCRLPELYPVVKPASKYVLGKIMYLLLRSKLVKSIRPVDGDKRFHEYIVPNPRLYLQIKQLGS